MIHVASKYGVDVMYRHTRITVAEKGGVVYIVLTNAKHRLLKNLSISDNVITLVVQDYDDEEKYET